MVSLFGLDARQILDSRGFPTVEVEAHLSDGTSGRASVPSGASTGSHEALELRDGDQTHFQGKGVLEAVQHVKDVISPKVLSLDPFDQQNLDLTMIQDDGTQNLSSWGANAVLGVSLAVSRAAAASRQQPYYRYIREIYQHQGGLLTPQGEAWKLPIPMFNVMNGGAHTHWETTDFQEFMILPLTAPTFATALEQGSLVYHYLGQLLHDQGLSSLVGDEGGFAPQVKDNQAAMNLVIEAIQHASLREGIDIGIGLDSAASEFCQNGMYELKKENLHLTSQQFQDFWRQWLATYPMTSIEDPLAEDDWDGWSQFTKEFGAKYLVVGDDLLVTNPERIQKAIDSKACNALLMKINQIGTLTKSFEAVKLARSAGWKIVVSHRSGETEDTSIADIAVGLGADFVKMGAPARTERVAKYNQLMRIEEEITLNN